MFIQIQWLQIKTTFDSLNGINHSTFTNQVWSSLEIQQRRYSVYFQSLRAVWRNIYKQPLVLWYPPTPYVINKSFWRGILNIHPSIWTLQSIRKASVCVYVEPFRLDPDIPETRHTLLNRYYSKRVFIQDSFLWLPYNTVRCMANL